MASVTIQTQAGKSTGEAELVETMFGVEPNMAVMHQVVTAQLAARRAGTHSTKTRSEVRVVVPSRGVRRAPAVPVPAPLVLPVGSAAVSPTARSRGLQPEDP